MQHAQHICVQIAQKTIWGSPHVRCPPLRRSIFNSDKYILFFSTTYQTSSLNSLKSKTFIFFLFVFCVQIAQKSIWVLTLRSTFYFFYLLPIFLVKYKKDKNIAWIKSHHLHLQWKFKLLAGKFTWDVKAKHCWVMSTNFLFSKNCWNHTAIFCLITSSKLSRQ